jgi:hypothetical protein
MKNIKVTKLYNEYTGFSEQIFFLILNILHCIDNNQHVLVIGNFLKEINTNNTIPITELLDLNKINIFLMNNYHINIVYNCDNNFKFINILYGSENMNIDITNEFLSKFIVKDKKFLFKNTINLNDLRGDPCPNEEKKLHITYIINGRKLTDIYDVFEETLIDDICFNFNDKYRTWCSASKEDDEDKFNFILKNIYFNSNIIEKANQFINLNFNENDKINCLHIRIDEDACKKWSKINNISENEFKEKLEKKYKEIIQQFIKKTDKNIILSWSQDNNVINFLRENEYNISFIEKDYSVGREICAAIDLNISKCCNNFFIGNYNPFSLKNNCSKFSYYISKNLKPEIKQICIDLENIDNLLIHYQNI